MLSYRHAFHAGNHADVLKHAVLCACIDYLKKKDKPFTYHDTHAGAGQYPLQQAMMKKNEEYQTGITKLLAMPKGMPDALKRYKQTVQACNPHEALSIYPGSPLLVSKLLRPHDKMQLTELHPDDSARLNKLFAANKQVRVLKQDAWQGIKALLPPQLKRGMVLIDPPYELKHEYRDVVNGLKSAYQRFATGTYAIWYPVLERQSCERFMQQLKKTGIPAMLRLELSITEDLGGRGMTGSGMVVINPPWTLADEFAQVLPWLVKALQYEHRGSYKLEWLNPAP